MSLLTTSKQYSTRPSKLLCIEDEYIAYCLDEACAYIISQLEEGIKPKFIEDEKENKGLQMLLGV